MIKNIATFDRAGRIIFALAVLALYMMGKIGGGLAIGLGALGAILFITSLLGFCPIYRILGVSTCKIKE